MTQFPETDKSTGNSLKAWYKNFLLEFTWGDRFFALALISFVFVLTIGVLRDYPSISFHSINEVKISELLVSIFFACLIVERSLEVFITTWRGVRATELKREVDNLQETASVEGNKRTELMEKQVLLAKYQARTKHISLRFGVVLGILVSLVGIRILEPFFEISNLNQEQQHYFRVVDILLTGFTISGGSKEFHALISVYTDFMESSRKKVNPQNETSSAASTESSTNENSG